MSSPIKTVNIETTDGESYTASYTHKDGKGETRQFDSFDEANEWVHEVHATSVEQPELQQELDPGIVEAQENAQENTLNQIAQNDEEAGETPRLQETETPDEPVEKPKEEQGSKQETSSTNTKS